MKSRTLRPWRERLWEKAAPDANGCLVWQGRSVLPNGYAVFYGPAGTDERQSSYAHRWAYIAAHGPIPAGLHIDHLCSVRLCINPSHLEAVTPRENSRRTGERQTHCKWGHERTEENTYRSKGGWRACKPCKLLAVRTRRQAVAA
jgi:hypothetical protein